MSSYINGDKQELDINPWIAAGVGGASYTVINAGNAGDASGISRSRWHLVFFGAAEGTSDSLRTSITVAVHWYASDSTAGLGTANNADTWNGDERDMHGFRSGSGTAVYLGSDWVVLEPVTIPPTESSTGAARVTYRGELRRDFLALRYMTTTAAARRNVGAVLVASDFCSMATPIAGTRPRIRVVSDSQNMFGTAPST